MLSSIGNYKINMWYKLQVFTVIVFELQQNKKIATQKKTSEYPIL